MFALVHIPQVDRLIRIARGEPRTVGADVDHVVSRRQAKLSALLAVSRIPGMDDDLVQARDGDQGFAIDRQPRPVARKLPQVLAVDRVPDVDLLVPTAGYDP